MLLSPDGKKVVSSWGWTDQGHIAWFDSGTNKLHREPVPGLETPTYTVLFEGEDNLFVAQHGFGERGLTVLTVHSFDIPPQPIATCRAADSGATFEGDHRVWAKLPRFYRHEKWEDKQDPYWLLEIASGGESIRLEPMDWFRNKYDDGYQQPLAPLFVKERNEVLIGVQRSDKPVRIDVSTRKLVGRIELAGRLGNPLLTRVKTRPQICAVDYDSLVILDAATYKILSSSRLQNDVDGGGAPIGEVSMSLHEKAFVVPRPCSHDILVLDTQSLRQIGRVPSKHEPYGAMLMPNGLMVNRDWKTGKFEIMPSGIDGSALL